jgi:hypothetical protein
MSHFSNLQYVNGFIKDVPIFFFYDVPTLE